MDIPEEFSEYNKSKIAVVPVPYDKTSVWVKGSEKGPAAIINASAFVELYDLDADSEVFKNGIYTDKFVFEDNSSSMINAVEKKIKEHIEKGKFTIVLGGEHTVTIGAVKAYNKCFRNLTVLQLDAHTDSRDSYNSDRYSHACAMARVKEICPVVHAGIRSMSAEEKEKLDLENVFFAKDMLKDDKWMDEVISRLSENVYVTIDLDVFDPSIMPSTGTPEPGGLLWHDLLEFLKKLSIARKIVGFDVVELCPNEHNKAPDFLAAKLIYTFLGYIMKDNNK